MGAVQASSLEIALMQIVIHLKDFAKGFKGKPGRQALIP